MRRKKEKVICVVLASMLFLVGCSEKTNPEGGSEDGYQVIELTMAVNGTDNQIDARVGDYFAQLVEERSGGNVTVAVFPNDQLAGGNASPTPVAYDGLPVGAYVQHAIFGIGKVIETNVDNGNAKAVIDFGDQGQKTLLLKFAKLKVLK